MSKILSQPISGGVASGMPTDGTFRYFALVGSQMSITATIADADQIVAYAGEFSDLYIDTLFGPPGVGTELTWSLFVNDAQTALRVAISGTNTEGIDRTNKVRVVAGDVVCIGCQATVGVPAGLQVRGFVIRFRPDKPKHTLLLAAGTHNHLFPVDNQYNMVQGWDYWTETEQRSEIIPAKGTIKHLYVTLDAAPGGATSSTFTLQKNDIDTALTVTISGANTSGSDLTNSVAVSLGDTVRLHVTRSGAPTQSSPRWGSVFVPLSDGESIMMSMEQETPTAAAQYGHLTAKGDISSTFQYRCDSIYRDFYIKNLFVGLEVAPGAGETIDFWLTRELQTGSTTTQDTTLHVQIAGAVAVVASDTVHQVYMSYNVSCVAIKHDASATATVQTRMRWSVCFREHLKSNLRLRVIGRKPHTLRKRTR